MTGVLSAIREALQMAFFMFWEVLWPLVLGFLISAIVQSLVSREAVVRVLGRDDLRGVTFATVLGAASSSCSYAAVAVGRGLFRKGATFANAILFEFASTNLVFELGLVLLVLLGWQFLAAELAGGLLMIAILAVIFKYTLRARLIEAARAQAEKGLTGRMEGHGEMDMSVTEGPFLARLFSPRGLTAISHNFWMDVTSVWTDIGLGLLIAGALAAWVPSSFWQGFFLTSHPVLSQVWGPLIGPVISLLSFVCSVGNVPLAAVLWNGGISFGGVIAFIFADLIILPIVNAYRKYYGARMAALLVAVMFAAMAVAALVVDGVFSVAGLVPSHRPSLASISERPITWNYTTVLDILFALVFVALIALTLRRGAKDPVCGMTVDRHAGKPTSTYGGKTFYFCGEHCRHTFNANPQEYA